MKRVYLSVVLRELVSLSMPLPVCVPIHVCAYAHGEELHMHVCAHACGGQRAMSAVIPCVFFSLRLSLTGLELAKEDRLAD